MSPADKRRTFRALHQSGCFVIPNPWNIGSARYLQGLGFKALATTSSGYAHSQGFSDGDVTRDMMLAHCRELVRRDRCAGERRLRGRLCPRSGGVAENVALVRRNRRGGIVDRGLHRRRRQPALRLRRWQSSAMRAARAAIDKAGGDVVFTGRTEGFIIGRPDLDETIRRLKAYADAGADCLYAPGIRTREQIEAVVKAVAPKPVNLLMSAAQRAHRQGHRRRWACAASASAARWRASPWMRSSSRRARSPMTASSTVLRA